MRLRLTGLIALLACISGTNAEAIELPLLASSYVDTHRWSVDSGWSNGPHQSCEWRNTAVSARDGNLVLTLSDKGGAARPIGCGEIQSTTRYGYGLYEARMRSAAGSGLNSAFFTYIGPPQGVPEWDEIDFEFLGKNTHAVQVGYYANGKPQPGKTVDLGFDASAAFHNYSFEWTPTKIRWFVDSKLVFESADGFPLPRNPGKIFFSLWSGAQGEDAWMGHFTYTAPVTAEVQWTKFTPMQ